TPAPSPSRAGPTPPRCSPSARASSYSSRRRASRKAPDSLSGFLELGEGPRVGEAHMVRGAVGAEVEARRRGHRLALEQLQAEPARIAPAIGINIERTMRLR